MSNERKKKNRKSKRKEDSESSEDEHSSSVCTAESCPVPQRRKRDPRLVNAFNAIVEFINDLWEIYSVKNDKSPLALYHRLLSHILFTDEEALENAVGGFRAFFVENLDYILNDQLDNISRDTKITYGTSNLVYLEIQKYIYKSKTDPETRSLIRKHLLTISAIISPDHKTIKELEKKLESLPIDDNTNEGKFVHGIMSKVKDTMESLDSSNPGAAITGLFQSGILTDMIAGLQHGVGSGQMNPRKLFGTMQNAMNELLPTEPEDTKEESQIVVIETTKPTEQ